MKYVITLLLLLILAGIGYAGYVAYNYHLTATSIVKYTAEAKAKKECMNKVGQRLNFVNGKWICDTLKFR